MVNAGLGRAVHHLRVLTVGYTGKAVRNDALQGGNGRDGSAGWEAAVPPHRRRSSTALLQCRSMPEAWLHQLAGRRQVFSLERGGRNKLHTARALTVAGSAKASANRSKVQAPSRGSRSAMVVPGRVVGA